MSNVHSCFLLREQQDPEFVLTDHLLLHFIELPKFQEVEQSLEPKLWHWIYFLKHEGEEENQTMKVLLQDDADIRKAHAEYQYFSRDAKVKQIYEARMKRKLDEKSALYEAEQKGKIESKIEGIVGMYKAGVAVEQIAAGMQFPLAEVIEILKKQGICYSDQQQIT